MCTERLEGRRSMHTRSRRLRVDATKVQSHGGKSLAVVAAPVRGQRSAGETACQIDRCCCPPQTHAISPTRVLAGHRRSTRGTFRLASEPHTQRTTTCLKMLYDHWTQSPPHIWADCVFTHTELVKEVFLSKRTPSRVRF